MYYTILKSRLCAQRVWNFFITKNYQRDVMQLSLLLATLGTTRKIQLSATSRQLIVDFSDRLFSELTRIPKTRTKSLRSLITENVNKGSLVLTTNLIWMGLSRQDLLFKAMISSLERQLLSGMFRIFMKMVQNF
jgi:hypothetical protein